jgi:hypothetical protein
MLPVALLFCFGTFLDGKGAKPCPWADFRKYAGVRDFLICFRAPEECA